MSQAQVLTVDLTDRLTIWDAPKQHQHQQMSQAQVQFHPPLIPPFLDRSFDHVSTSHLTLSHSSQYQQQQQKQQQMSLFFCARPAAAPPNVPGPGFDLV
jgi:hypothetical protein